MGLVFDRARAPQISQHLANVPWSKYLNRLEKSRQFNVFPSGNGIYQVEIPDTGFKYIVNLANELCDCKDFYEYQGPCTHAIAASRHQGGDPLALFYNRYTTQYFRRTYSHPVIPVSINDLRSDSLICLHLYANYLGDHAQNDIAKGSGQGSRNNVAIA
jgi:hypothetical protein